MLSRKDYIDIATLIKESNKDYDTLVNSLIGFMMYDNVKFDRDKFVKACKE